jgi:hypothetical protein
MGFSYVEIISNRFGVCACACEVVYSTSTVLEVGSDVLRDRVSELVRGVLWTVALDLRAAGFYT